MRSKASARTSPAELDELARLHDGRHTAATLIEHADVLERVSVNDQNVGTAPGADLAEVGLHQDLGIHSRRRPQDRGGRLYFSPDQKLAGLLRVEVPKKVGSKTDLEPKAIH